MGTHVTLVKTEAGDDLGEWETEHPIRSGDQIVDGDVEWNALYYSHNHNGRSYLIVRKDFFS